ncbi:MAG: 3-dehydroquinate synthase II [Thermoplasmatota archaeon]
MTARIPLWVDLRGIPVNKRLPYLYAVENAHVERVLLAKADPHLERPGLPAAWVDAKGGIHDASGAVARLQSVHDRKSQERAAKATGTVVVEATDWKVIPLENLVAGRRDRPGSLFAVARSPAQARLFSQVLETGVHGVLLIPGRPTDVSEADHELRLAFRAHALPEVQVDAVEDAPAAHATVEAPVRRTPPPATLLEEASVTSVEEAGMGERVCVDTTSLLGEGEGLLVGSTARSFALVHAETEASPLLPARPFRVNAGAVHSYLLGPEGKTRYLSELAAGQMVLLVSASGATRVATIGRCKVERRPLTLVRWRGTSGEGMAVLQTAETVCLVAPGGKRLPVTSLRAQDRILVHPETAGRHAGLAADGHLDER